MSKDLPQSVKDAVAATPAISEDCAVRSRGRPERSPEDTARRHLRRISFGARLRELREGAGLTLIQASVLSGLNSARKLSQYETTCYPPGSIVSLLAPHYGVSPQALAELLLSHCDPDLYQALTGREGYEPPDEAVKHCLLSGNPKSVN